MRVIVCGPRQWGNPQLIFDTLHMLAPSITSIIEGGATGADRIANTWAKVMHRPCRTFEADWGKFGRSAGMIRNRQMLQEGRPDLVLAFQYHGEETPGTQNMIKQAVAAGCRVMVSLHSRSS